MSRIASPIKPAAVAENLVSTYYLYSYDGRLLAEYDQGGACVRDYIYFGSTLLAEYRPAAGAYYYYTSDQVNSVRMITNGAGQVVYSAAYSPYGKIHTEWVNTYQPSRKFSGKEREWGSGLDDFGARYYDNQSYRFLSPDPVIGRNEAIANPQLWNLYAYCRNNPITYMDPNGQKDININIIRFYESKTATIGFLYVPELNVFGFTLELPWKANAEFKSRIPPDNYNAHVYKNRWIAIENVKNRTGIMMHPGIETGDTTGCILGMEKIDIIAEKAIGGWSSTQKIMGNLTAGMKEEKKLDEKSAFRVNVVDFIFPAATMAIKKIFERR